MKKTIRTGISAAMLLMIAPGFAVAEGGFAEHLTQCVDKFASGGDGAKVMLACVAKDGKMTGCSVIENSAPAQGYDKAAVCVAAFLPAGSRSGDIRIPIIFPGKEQS